MVDLDINKYMRWFFVMIMLQHTVHFVQAIIVGRHANVVVSSAVKHTELLFTIIKIMLSAKCEKKKKFKRLYIHSTSLCSINS